MITVYCTCTCKLHSIVFGRYRYKGPLKDDGALIKSVQGEDILSEFMILCKWLTDDIQAFSGVIENITGRY